MTWIWIALTDIGHVYHYEADVTETQGERASTTIISDQVIQSKVIMILTSVNHDQHDTSRKTTINTNLNMSFNWGAGTGNIDEGHGGPGNHLNDAH